jgi:endonuclease YncB( thermonuclease family)
MFRSFAVVLFVAFSTCTAEEFTLEGNVVSIEHGDAITLSCKGTKKLIYLRGTDAPDKDQKYWSDSKKNISDLLKDKSVEVHWTDVDGAGRLMAEVLLNGKSVNRQMINDGWSWHYSQQFESEEYAKDQAEAKAAKRGIWADSRSEAPWVHRQKVHAETKPFSPSMTTTQKTLKPAKEIVPSVESKTTTVKPTGDIWVDGHWRKTKTGRTWVDGHWRKR